MLDYLIVKFAKENGFRSNGDVIFGLYKGQLLTIGAGTHSVYHVVCTMKSSLKSQKDKFKTSEILKKYKLHGGIQFNKKGAVSWTIRMGFRRNKEERLLNILEAIVEEIGKYQKFADSGEVVLQGKIARFKNELGSETAASKIPVDPDLFLGTTAAFIATVIAGVVLGYIQYIMMTKANLSWNPAFTGFISCALVALAYKKFAGKVDILCRILFIPLSGIGHLIALSITQYYYLKALGYDVSFSMLQDRLFQILSDKPIYQSLALVGGVVLAVTTKPRDADPDIIESGEEISDNAYNNLREHKKGDKIAVAFFIVALIYFFAGLILSTTGTDGPLDRTSAIWPFLFYALIIHTALVAYGYRLASKHKSIELTLTHFGMKPVGAKGKLVILNLLVLFASAGSFGFLVIANSRFDRSNAVKHLTTVMNGRYVGKGVNSDFCHSLRHWKKNESFGTMRLCYKKYGSLRNDEKVNVFVKNGFLGVPWISKIHLPRFESFRTFLESLEKEENLRSKETLQFFNLAEKDPEEKLFADSKVSQWEKQCHLEGDYTCRLRSYYSNYKKDQKGRIQYLDKGCDGGDVIACYGLYTIKETSEDQKAKYFALLKKKCGQNKWDLCLQWGAEMWNTDYQNSYEMLLKLYAKTCREGKKETACEALEKLKMYPVHNKSTI